jgi:carbon monoxide dehydrogenase subunit G
MPAASIAAEGKAMHRIRKSIEIKAPPERVYDFVTQPTNYLNIMPGMVEVSNVARRSDGSHEFDWVYKMAGLHFKGHSKSEETQPKKLSRTRNEGGIASTFTWTFEGMGASGTKLAVDVEYTIPTPVIGRLAEALVARMNERELSVTLENLKEMVESAAGPAVTADAPRAP